MLSVNQSVLLMQSVQMIKLVSTTIVKIHVLEYVVSMHHVMSPIIFHSVHVILGIQEMLLFHAQGLQHVSLQTFINILILFGMFLYHSYTAAPVTERIDPCNPSPCGTNAVCQNRGRAAACQCIPDYFGDPYVACRPECTTNAECPSSKACQNLHCVDPCPAARCGVNAQCQVVNHIPNCVCIQGYIGDPFTSCRQPPLVIEPVVEEDPCNPNPCGPNSNPPRVIGDRCHCTCLPEMIGSPPNCRPECIVNSDCSSETACINRKCQDPCPGLCGVNAYCRVRNHVPICVCNQGYIGDPFSSCYRPTTTSPRPEIIDPCRPSPCGINAECRERNGAASCTCYPGLQGDPYVECKHECTINPECASNLACISNKCRDPCPGVCGAHASCSVNNHFPSCTCDPGYTGDPFRYCTRITTCEIVFYRFLLFFIIIFFSAGTNRSN